MNKYPGFRKRIALELFRGLKRNRTKLHELRTLFWECTTRCTQACPHCRHHGNNHPDSSSPEMAVSDFMKVITNITPHVSPEQVTIQLIGGEPLLRPDIEDCGEELTRRSFCWGLHTNGHLLTSQRLDALCSVGMKTVTLGLDGFQENHDRARNNPDSFAQSLEALCLLTERSSLQTEVVTRVNPDNLKELSLFKDFLVEMGVKKWRIFAPIPAREAGGCSEMPLSSEQFTWLLRFIRFCRHEGKIKTSYKCEGFLGNYEAEVRDQPFQCLAGITIASVLANGSISGCPGIPTAFHQGNIYTDSFMEVWNSRFQPYRNRAWAKTEACADCSLFRYCEGGSMHLRDAEGKLLCCHYKNIL